MNSPLHRLCLATWVVVLTTFACISSLPAQDHTLLFSTTAPGVSKAITNWGLDLTWASYDNMRRGLMFMGTNEVDMVRVAFLANAPVTNGVNGNDLSTAQKAELSNIATLANMAGPSKPWTLSSGTGAGVDPWFKNGSEVIASRWVQAMEAAKKHYNHTILSTEPFNEPDYGWGQGTVQNLYDILGLLQVNTNFTGVTLSGGSTLNCDQANSWYDPIKSRITEGTTHTLAGGFNGYVNFIQNVVASGDVPVNPEAHNVMEVIAGAEYGLRGSIWWGTAELARGEFVKANQGQRLGYAEDRGKWTAAAVYRAPTGKVQAFVGVSERMATTTSYRFFSKDRDVFYDGDGPRRDYTVTIPGGTGYATPDQRNAEKLVNISWGEDVQPAINGRYFVVARHSTKVMEVAGASTGDGANIQQNAYSGGTHQQWDFIPLPSTNGGDYSYFSVKAAHSGKSADVNNWGHDDGVNVMQWANTGNPNQHWFLEYAGNGYFYIRSRWSGKYLAGISTANGANIHQWSGTGGLNQQWRLIPLNALPTDLTPPPVPAGVTAIANALSVQLSWNAVVAADLAGYTVLRSTNSGGPYEIIARGLTNTNFTDKAANQPRTYFYAVKAADRSLNSSTNSAQASATPGTGPTLAGRYTFDGNANDSSGNANHPIILNGSPTFVAGRYGSAMDLNGTSQYAMLPAGLFASVTNFTIAVWVNWDGGGAWQRIFDFGNDTTQYMFLTPSSGSSTLRFAITTNGGGAEQLLQTSPLPVGQWQHVVITRNGNTTKLYTNGVVAVSASITIPPASLNPALNYLGKSQYPDPLFNGRLDELFIYNYALSDSEITRLAANQPPPPTTPTSLATSLAGNSLLMLWPSNYLGCRLESNSISLTAPGSWFTVVGSAATNQMMLPINVANSNVFFRLVYP